MAQAEQDLGFARNGSVNVPVRVDGVGIISGPGGAATKNPGPRARVLLFGRIGSVDVPVTCDANGNIKFAIS
jgi:hypothetical protein